MSDNQLQIHPDSSMTDQIAKLSLLIEGNEDSATLNKSFDEVTAELKSTLAGSDNGYKVVAALFTHYTKDWLALTRYARYLPEIWL